MIGPSGCGKTTFLRSVNRINERLGYVRTTGSIEVLGHDIYAPGVEIVQVRKLIGMVFQRPNPLPLSIRDNVIFGYRLHSGRKRMRSSSRPCGRSCCGTRSKTGSIAPPRDCRSRSSRSSASPACCRSSRRFC